MESTNPFLSYNWSYVCKITKNVSQSDLRALRQFEKDYPQSELFLFYGGTRKQYHHNITFLPVDYALKDLHNLL